MHVRTSTDAKMLAGLLRNHAAVDA
jgi:hypothetical protein